MKSQVLMAFIAAVTAAAANGAGINLVTQGDFNVPGLSSTGGSYGPVAGSAWAFTGASGIAAPGPNSAWAPVSQDGTAGSQVAFLQQQDEFSGPESGNFSQTLTGLTTGTSYTLTFYYADRLWSDGVNAYFAPDPFTVSLNGAQLGSILTPPAGTTPASFAYTMFTTTFVASGSSETLNFATAGTPVGTFAACQANFVAANCYDDDTVISNVSVVSQTPAASPEPGTFALLIPAMGGLALAVRRRYKTTRQ